MADIDNHPEDQVEPGLREEPATNKRKIQIFVITVVAILALILTIDIAGKLREQKRDQQAASQARVNPNNSTGDIDLASETSVNTSGTDDAFSASVLAARERQAREERLRQIQETQQARASVVTDPENIEKRLERELREREEQRKALEARNKTSSGSSSRVRNVASSSGGSSADADYKASERERVLESRQSEFELDLDIDDDVPMGTPPGRDPFGMNEAAVGSPASQGASSGSSSRQQSSTQVASRQRALASNVDISSRDSDIVGSPASVDEPLPGQKLLPMSTVIRAVLDSRVVSDYPGPFRGMIMDDVYDVSKRHILIPKGSRVSGGSIKVSNVNEPIQARMGLSVQHVILPNGKKISFDKSATLDREGIRGIKDQVNRHLFTQVLGVAAFALISSETDRTGSGDFNDNTFEGEVGESLRRQFSPIAQRYINLRPTITLNPGTPMRIYLEDEMYIYPWDTVGDSLYPKN